MERRELLKALVTLPMIRQSRKGFEEVPVEKAAAVEVAPHKYWVFIDVQAVDLRSFTESPWSWPGCDAEIFPVMLRQNQTIQDVIAIYKIADDGKEAVR